MSIRKFRVRRLWIALALVSVSTVSGFAGDERLLNRSFYVPLRFDFCEHFEEPVLYRDGAAIQELPGTHVFQFTFYPKLKRLEPALERVRIDGLKHGERFKTEVVVTPASVYIGSKKIELDLEGQMEAMRKSIDVRHEPVELTLRCDDSCGRRIAGNR